VQVNAEVALGGEVSVVKVSGVGGASVAAEKGRSRRAQVWLAGQARWPRPAARKGESSGEGPAAAHHGQPGATEQCRERRYVPVRVGGSTKGRAEDGGDGVCVVEGRYLGASFFPAAVAR